MSACAECKRLDGTCDWHALAAENERLKADRDEALRKITVLSLDWTRAKKENAAVRALLERWGLNVEVGNDGPLHDTRDFLRPK